MIYSMDGTLYGFSAKRVKNLFEAYSASSENYSKAYVTWISPLEFLSLTTSDVSGFLDKNKDKLLDYKELCGERQEIFLTVDFEAGEVVGHEGRHRMAALHFAGAEKVAIAVRADGEKGKYDRKFIPEITVTGQEFWMCRPRTRASGVVNLKGLVPVSKACRDVVRELFGPDAALHSYLGKETCVGVVQGFSDDGEKAKPVAECAQHMSNYVHVQDRSNPESIRDIVVPVEEFMDWIEIARLGKSVKETVASLEDQIKSAECTRYNGSGSFEGAKEFEIAR